MRRRIVFAAVALSILILARIFTTKVFYDDDLDRTALIDPGAAWSFATHDAAGNVTTRTSALGSVETFTYDAANNPTTYTDPRATPPPTPTTPPIDW